MAQVVNLDSAQINLNSLRDHARMELVDALDSVRGRKLLVLDPKLSGPLTFIAQIALLKEHGVENLYHLSGDPLPPECRAVMYLVRPRIELMHLIAAQIRADMEAGGSRAGRQYSLFFVPRRTIVCEKVLETEGVYADVTIGEYSLDLIPFEEDVLSLELEMSYKECHVDGDRSSLYTAARAITKLQAVFGTIPNVKAKGRAATLVADMLHRMRREQQEAGPPPAASSEIDTIILLDRQVDMVTPMCTQLTYEGLLDEMIGISAGAVEVDPAVLGLPPGGRKQKVPLNSSDKLFREMRDLNFGAVGQMLRHKTASMKQDYVEVTAQTQSVSELKDFVKKIQSLPEMTRHVNLAQHLSTFTTRPAFLQRLSMEQSLVEGRNADTVYEYVEELVQKQEPPLEGVLRLLCLLSLTGGGLPKKQFDQIRREVLHSYGFEHLITLENLEKAGLLKKQEAKSNWAAIRKTLQLVVDDGDDAHPKDIAYTYSGYAPLSVRLIQHGLRGGWQSIDDVMRTLPGPSVERRQAVEAPGGGHPAPGSPRDAPPGDSNGVHGGERALVLVVFLGGVTFAEIAALRFLSAQEDSRYDYLIVTTKIVTGTSLLSTLVEDLRAPVRGPKAGAPPGPPGR